MFSKKWITLQSEERDCGASCISSILKYYNGYVPLPVISEDCHMTKDGITAYDLIQTFQKYGLQARGLKDVQIESLQLPSVIHFQLPNGLFHYVVLYSIQRDTFLLMDPSCGKVKMTREEFMALWTGVVIEVIPVGEVISYEKRSHLQDLFLSFYQKEKKSVLILVLLSVLFNILLIVGSYYTQVALQLQGELFQVSLVFFGLFFLKLIVFWIRNHQSIQLSYRLDTYFVFPFLKHVLFLPLKKYMHKSDGEFMKRIQEYTSIKDVFSDVLLSGVLYFLEILFSLSVILWMRVGFGMVLLVLIVLLLFFYFLQKESLLRVVDLSIESDTLFQSQLTEHLQTMSTWRHLDTSYFKSRLEDTTLSMHCNKKKLFAFMCRLQTVEKFILEFVLFSLYTYSFYLYTLGQMNLYDVLILQILIGYFIDAFQNVLHLLPRYFYVQRTFSKISEFLDIEEEELGLNEFLTIDLIEASHLGFTYNQRDYYVQDISFCVTKGSKVLLFGKSGCGKSTLCKLLYRLYEPSCGTLLLNGKPISSFSIASVRNCISYVSQEDVLFADTIWNNLTLGKKKTLEEVYRVLSLCCMKDFVFTLPLGIYTPLAGGGLNLSGGQRQRLILARALLDLKQVIVLDEALSQVDYPTEKRILTSLLSTYATHTILYVSHRDFSSLFDQVIAFNQKGKLCKNKNY